MYLLDTNILSEVIRARPAPTVANRFEAAPPEQLFTSVICLEEIRFGTLIGPPGNRLWERTEAKVLTRVALLPVDQAVALLAASLRAEWKMQGTPVGYRDGLIAGTAKAHGLVLVSRNVQHFDHVAGLKIENWFEPPPATV
jgi:predicted nucleic acid-binding protein